MMPPTKAPARNHKSTDNGQVYHSRSKTKEMPGTETEARDHISNIRHNRSLDRDSLKDMAAALYVLSENLYQKPYSFLLELLQNTDDKSYDVNNPKINITYAKRALKEDDWPPDLGEILASISFDQNVMNLHKQPTRIRDIFMAYCRTVSGFANLIPEVMFALTERGYAALVPGDSVVGDEVCVVDGGVVPFVLRRKGVGGENNIS
ncbi:hypothetical protein G7Y89_g5798 [Cudoniella acicularis]|uniref:Uncharacterized protein n=1 Tax=Cudoniella acicularis TaxID=354080 RepID=A0A8H4RNZ7_9HELO|nr:hypothetical protein G7Y89_g5798 [Cudoniella acicularis]